MQRVSALVVNKRAADAGNDAVLVGRDGKLPNLIALLHRIGEVLAPVLDPFDRTPQQLGGRRYRNVLGIDAELGAEAAADFGRDHSDFAIGQAQQHGD